MQQDLSVLSCRPSALVSAMGHSPAAWPSSLVCRALSLQTELSLELGPVSGNLRFRVGNRIDEYVWAHWGGIRGSFVCSGGVM